MRVFVCGTVMCAAWTLTQCKNRNFSDGSNVNGVKDIASMQDDENGKFNVICKDGRREREVTAEAIEQGDVCKSDAGVQLNPKAFNSFNIWLSGQGTEIVDYPAVYGDMDPKPEDGVFFVSTYKFWADGKTIGVPTERAKVYRDVLEYPVRNGKQLRLKFAALEQMKMKQANAVQHCKRQGLRLPTARELLDFCYAGISSDVSGRFPQNRCNSGKIWSASLLSNAPGEAWLMGGTDGAISAANINAAECGVRCVGPIE